MLDNYELGIEFFKNGKLELSKNSFIKAYEEGNKNAIYYLREIRNINDKNINTNINTDVEYYTNKSRLGYEVDIPKNWTEVESIDDKCFDTITIDKYDDYIYNVKTQGFLIEIPKGCIELISIDGVIAHMGNLDEVKDYKNNFCKGKLIKTEEIDGTINYILLTTGNRGIYQFKISVDKFLNEKYKEIIEYIFSSIRIIE